MSLLKSNKPSCVGVQYFKVAFTQCLMCIAVLGESDKIFVKSRFNILKSSFSKKFPRILFAFQVQVIFAAREPLKNVGEAASARQKQTKKRSLGALNEHF
ncbi:MAG TPA: hypothetical protein VN030_06465 [Cellvibrio sp.]|nr:hypothetical protein [Cellvibrio sp.]